MLMLVCVCVCRCAYGRECVGVCAGMGVGVTMGMRV